MRTIRLARFMAAALVGAVASASITAQPALRPEDAEQLKRKAAAIAERSRAARRQPARTMVTEREVNAYLAFAAAGEIPAGVVEPSVNILGADRVRARAIVDLDRVRQQRASTTLLDPWRYLRGRLPVQATGLLRSRDGVASLELEAADVAGVPVPKIVLQQIVAYYSRSAARPEGINLEAPLDLPAGIREIRVEPGQAIVIQ